MRVALAGGERMRACVCVSCAYVCLRAFSVSVSFSVSVRLKLGLGLGLGLWLGLGLGLGIGLGLGLGLRLGFGSAVRLGLGFEGGDHLRSGAPTNTRAPQAAALPRPTSSAQRSYEVWLAPPRATAASTHTAVDDTHSTATAAAG